MDLFRKTTSIVIILWLWVLPTGKCLGHSLGFLESMLMGGNHLFIGVTLHPYYSFVKNVAGDAANVIPITGAGFDVHKQFSPTPDQIKRAMTIDILVLSGAGHDDFAYDVLNAAKISANDIILIRPAADMPLIPMKGAGYKRAMTTTGNPHVFLSIDGAIQQVDHISRKMKMLDPENREGYEKNTEGYIKRLRSLKQVYQKRISGMDTRGFRCAATQASFDYLLQEFGLQAQLIFEPGHGVQPKGADIEGITHAVRKNHIQVIFSESGEKHEYVGKICDATGAKMYLLSHMTGGEYTADRFEKDMRFNLESLTRALSENRKREE